MNTQLYIKGIILLLLIVLGNFISETLSCSTRQILSNNIYVKQFIIFFLIYFTINFNSDNVAEHPNIHLKYAFYLWGMFYIISKFDVLYSMSIFLILTILYTLQNYIDHHTNKSSDKNIILRLHYYQTILWYVLILLCILGIIDMFNLNKPITCII